MKNTLIILFFFINTYIFANDGAYYTSGNQLIPMYESDISVRKEILSIKKIDGDKVLVNVYYEFYNPKGNKNILVGFEAGYPEGDTDARPKNGHHPNISRFTVKMNDQLLPYKIAYTTDSIYYKNGTIQSLSLEQMQSNDISDFIDGAFGYVYHFNAPFKKGMNIIQHSYIFDMSGSVDWRYDFDYILTAANRWANQQIDDFTLIIDMGEFQDFYITDDFVKGNINWTVNGLAQMTSSNEISFPYQVENRKFSHFYWQTGNLYFHKDNFRPINELTILSLNFLMTNKFFSHENDILPYSYEQEYYISAQDELSLKILRNLPYARRGYIFKSEEIQKYYESMGWYKEDPNYQAEPEYLSEMERKWLGQLKPNTD